MAMQGKAPDTGLLILRAVLGIIFLSHGVPKLVEGPAMTAGFFAQLGIPLPGLSAWLVALLETFGGLALILGLLVSVFSGLLIIHMAVGILLVHLPAGWFVVGPGEGGAEFSVLLIAGLLVLILTGAGRPALDETLAARAGGGAGPGGPETRAPEARGPEPRGPEPRGPEPRGPEPGGPGERGPEPPAP